METQAIRKGLQFLPALDDGYLSFNVSPLTVLSGTLQDILRGGGAQRRIVLEITEHAQVNDYAALQRALAPLRRSGVRVAVDDAGAGYATLRHITELQPDLIKLDAHLTRNVEQDAIKRALIKAMTTFAREIGCDLVAEGIETERQRDLLLALGIRNGQGYLFGRPAPMAVVTH